MANNEKKRVTLFLNAKLLKRAKLQAVVEEISLTVLVEEALIKYLPEKLQVERIILKKKGGE